MKYISTFIEHLHSQGFILYKLHENVAAGSSLSFSSLKGRVNKILVQYVYECVMLGMQ